MERSIIDQMLAGYDSFTTAEKKIADYVVGHQQECQGMGITELSGACNVAVSTLSLFCRKLKLAGFHDFKIELARANTLNSQQDVPSGSTDLQEGDSTGEVMDKVCRRGQEVLRRAAGLLSEASVEQAVALLQQAEHVVILGQGNHAAIATMAWTQFAVTGPKFQTVQDAHLQTIAMGTLNPGDVVLYFSYTGATLEIMDAAKTIREVGAKLILVTRFARSPAAEQADVVLVSGGDERPLQFGSFDALFSQLYVLNVLLSAYYLTGGEPVIRNRERIGKELSRKLL